MYNVCFCFSKIDNIWLIAIMHHWIAPYFIWLCNTDCLSCEHTRYTIPHHIFQLCERCYWDINNIIHFFLAIRVDVVVYSTLLMSKNEILFSCLCPCPFCVHFCFYPIPTISIYAYDLHVCFPLWLRKSTRVVSRVWGLRMREQAIDYYYKLVALILVLRRFWE